MHCADMTDSHQHSHDDRRPSAEAVAVEWDARFSSSDRLFSGRANGSLRAEVSGLPAGRALDVGCGEGADAVWLAEQGWAVTALDVSQVALDRAAHAATRAGVEVAWMCTGLVEASLGDRFDLVAAHYPALPSSTGHECERALLAAVAPGGVLLVVHHADPGGAAARSHGFDPADYVGPTDLVGALLTEDWHVRIDTWRPRDVPTGGGGHTHDVVLRAHRARRALVADLN